MKYCPKCGARMNEIHSEPILSSSAIRTIPTGGTAPLNYARGSQNAPLVIEWKCPNCNHYEQERIG